MSVPQEIEPIEEGQTENVGALVTAPAGVLEDPAFDLDDEELEAGTDPKEFKTVVDEIIARCKAANIECESRAYTDDRMLLVKLPAGRQKRSRYRTSLE